MADLKDILNNEDNLKDEDILKYLQGKATDDEQREVEKHLTDSDFLSDAVEGLQAIENKRNIQDYVEELNRQLHKQTAAKRKRKDRLKLKEQSWILVAVAVVLVLCILAYLIIRMAR